MGTGDTDPDPKPRRAAVRGITLVEALVSVVLLALLLAVVVYTLSGVNGS